MSDEDIEKYVKGPLPGKQNIDEKMDQFSFMPRLALVEHDSIRVS